MKTIGKIVVLADKRDQYDSVSRRVFECGCGGQLFLLHESGHVVCIQCECSLTRLKIIDSKN